MAAKSSVPRLRAFLLAAIALTALGTGGVYLAKTVRAARNKAAQPVRIPASVNQAAQGFSISKTEGGRTLFKATAKKAVDFRETGRSSLEEVEIIIYGNTGDRSDRISSRRCDYDSKAGLIYSAGEVEIELASLPGESPLPAAGGPLWVKTSGLLFDQNTGAASTDHALAFRFRQGSGQARGAVYDAHQQTLWLKSDVQFSIERTPPVEVRAAELHYLQRQYQVRMTRPEFHRDQQLTKAEEGVMFLDEHHQAKSVALSGSVHGTDHSEGRDIEFRADRMDMTLGERQQVQTAVATGNVRADSRSAGGSSESHAASLEMDFSGPDAALHQALWKGGVRLVFTPPPSQPKGQVKTVTSEQVEMTMTPDGRELAGARTLAPPGRVELSGGGAPRRVLTAAHLWVEFAEQNQVKKLRAEGGVRTESDGPAGRPEPARITTSDALAAVFSPPSQQLESIEQTGHFRYQEGERQARGAKALYSASSGATLLTGGSAAEEPELWDGTGRVTARRIEINEKTGDAVAEQDVRSTQFSEAGAQPNALLASGGSSDPIHAHSEHLRWNRKSGVTFYEGGPGGRARLWQGRDVLEARTVEMERAARKVTAVGDVFSVLAEPGKEPLRVNSERLVYTDAGDAAGEQEGHARYEKNVVLKSREMTLTAGTVDAYLFPPEKNQQNKERKPSESRLKRTVASGKVRLDQPARPAAAGHPVVPARHAEAERAEYLPPEDKIFLSGGNPFVSDELRGSTAGRELTYFIADDRLLVVGDEKLRTHTQHRVTRKPR